MSPSYILTIDLGTSGPKVALFDEKANCIDHVFEEVPLLLSEGGGAEQRPSDWTTAIEKSYFELIQKTSIDPKAIAAINCTSQWSGTVAVDKEGKSLMNSIIWMDSRGADDVMKRVTGPINIEGYGAGKILKLVNLTGGAPAKSGKDPVGHILYIKRTLPEIYSKTYKFLEPKDYLNLWLTGIFASSFDCITLHWCTDNRNINQVSYHKGLLKMLDLDRDKLPDLVPANSVLGKVSASLAIKWGLSPDTQVVSGTPDVHSAAVGSGAVNDYEPHIYIGTSSWLVCHLPHKKTDIFHNMTTIPSAIPGRYMVANEQETTGACLNFLKNNLFYNQDELSQEPPPADFYKRLDKLVESTAPGSDNLVFLPWMYGERSPVEDHYARGGFYNLSLSHRRPQMVRAVYEGIALNTRWLLMYVEKMVGKQFEAINFIGGGARSEVWSQILADVYNRPIRQMEDPLMSNSRGTALLALQAIGKMKFEEFGNNVKVKKTFLPRKEFTKLYDERFKVFLQIYEKNKGIFKKLNQ
jgi:xylulokinase